MERVRGTVRCPDYESRVPQVLMKLRNLLETRGGMKTVGIFRIQPNAEEFPAVKHALNCNDFEFRIRDIHCIANAIKVERVCVQVLAVCLWPDRERPLTLCIAGLVPGFAG